MIRLSTWATFLILLSPLSAQAALWEDNFTRGLGTWTVEGDVEGARVTPDAGKSGLGLRLAGPAVVVSPALRGTAEDWLVLTAQLRRLSGPGAFTLTMVSGESSPPMVPPPLWRSSLPPDGKWHRVDLTISPPPGNSWRLVLGVEAEGLWHVDDLILNTTAAGRPPEDPWLKGLRPAIASDPLPDGWSPEGTLDATTRAVGDATELVVRVGGLTLSLPEKLEATRGERRQVLVLADNRGQVDKDLKVAVQVDSPGAAMSAYTVPIRSGGITALPAPVQVLQAGECWARFTFTVGKESASAPLRLQVAEAYPALGADLSAEDSNGPVLLRAAVPFLQFLLASAQASPRPGQGLRLPLTENGSVAALQAELEEHRPPLAQLAVAGRTPEAAVESVVEAYRALCEQVLPHLPGTALLSPSWPVHPSHEGLQPSPAMQAAFAAGMASSVQSIAVGLQELPAAGVMAERVDGRAQSAINPYWHLQDRRYDFVPLRTWLAQQGPPRPLLLDLSSLQAGVAPRLEMLRLARLLLDQTWQGSTGVLLDAQARLLLEADGRPRPVVYEAVQELWRELAGAVPMALPSSGDGLCGTGPEAPVRCWAFLRGSEGILFLANHTSVPQDVAAELRGEATQMQVLRLRAEGPAVTRQIQDVFRFSEEARARRQPAVYLRLAPAEVVGLALQLTSADWTWLRSVEKMKPREQPATGPKPASGDQPWLERGKSW